MARAACGSTEPMGEAHSATVHLCSAVVGSRRILLAPAPQENQNSQQARAEVWSEQVSKVNLPRNSMTAGEAEHRKKGNRFQLLGSSSSWTCHGPDQIAELAWPLSPIFPLSQNLKGPKGGKWENRKTPLGSGQWLWGGVVGTVICQEWRTYSPASGSAASGQPSAISLLWKLPWWRRHCAKGHTHFLWRLRFNVGRCVGLSQNNFEDHPAPELLGSANTFLYSILSHFLPSCAQVCTPEHSIVNHSLSPSLFPGQPTSVRWGRGATVVLLLLLLLRPWDKFQTLTKIRQGRDLCW